MSRKAELTITAATDLYGKIARTHENLMKLGAAKITVGAVEARLQSLERYWTKFDAHNDELLNYLDQVADSEYIRLDIPALAEEAYLANKGLLLDLLRNLKTEEKEAGTRGSEPSSQAPRTTLPRIQLPHFSGKYEDWPAFRDLFQSLIGRDTLTSSVEKLHYLKTCLKGEAELLIRSLPTTTENFERAWDVLVAYYENKRLLVRSYISQFTSLQKLKSESVVELRKLCHSVKSTVGSLESIGRPITKGEDLFVHLVVDLLDPRSRREWENFISDSNDPPSYDKLQLFLDRRLHTLESLQPVKVEAISSKPHPSPTQKTRTLHTRKQDSKRGRCSLCGQDHYIMFCDLYQSKTAEERKRHVEANDLCLNCLGRHKVSECSSQKTCSSCRARHHTTLHEACPSGESAKTSHLAQHKVEATTTVLLATARVRVLDRFGRAHTARALVDQGSESSLVSEALAQRLRLGRSPTSVAVYGIGGKQTGLARGQVTLQIRSLRDGPLISVAALVFPRLTLYEGGIKANRRAWTHVHGLELADPDFLATDPIDILLGADVYAMILQAGLRRGKSREPVAQKTALGWILSGAVGTTSTSRHASAHHCLVEEDLGALVQRFWQQEELPDAAVALSPADQQCENFFRQTHSRSADGRYVVRLPVVAPLPDFSVTRSTALRVLFSMERRFARDPPFRALYADFMRQYEDLRHMSRVTPDATSRRPVHYLPHHGVLRKNSVTTKLRVVFNGSTPTTSKRTLNDHLMVGPNLLPPLADVLLRWRRHRFGLATDVEKMFRQILVHPDDRDLQRILWRDSPQDSPAEYQLSTVTYGLACAPFLAMRALRQLAEDEGKQYPLGAAVLLRDVYMDDILTGAATMAETQEMCKQLSSICMAGGFPLRKWSASDSAVIWDIPPEHQLQRETRDWRPHEAHSTLGLQWHPATDDFSFATRHIALPSVTKRSVLSLVAQLFDPLGWLAPVVVRAKIAFQSTWLQGLEWDAPLDDASASAWVTFHAQIPVLEQIRVPRWINLGPSCTRVEVHGFSDASERAYSAVVYLKTWSNDSWIVRLITAKTKVTPLKQVSLPRLELSAAVLLCRLAKHALTILDLTAPLHLWTDSTVALGWIRGHPSRWQTYVANRVSEIQRTTPQAAWHHVPGQDNPADCASRGLSPKELQSHPLWWQGPPWLRLDATAWPTAVGHITEEHLPEKRTRVHVKATAAPMSEAAELVRFSSLKRLLRVTAWCRRWLRVREDRSTGTQQRFPSTLSAEEIERARVCWIRRVQSEKFRAELKLISQGLALSKSNSLARFSPFLGTEGLLRVGGRLKHSILAYDERHPVLLPKGSHLTRLIVDDCHKRALHGGTQLTLSLIRQHYWIPRGRALVKEAILRCLPCVRWRAATPQQLMSDLPRERVVPARPFLHTGVDYAGPIQLRTTKGRGHRSYKAFVAVFVCLASRAVHLEVVSDYTAEAFLAALRRFVSRRGICRSLRSDCGTTFVGADSQLTALFTAGTPENHRIIDSLASERIEWRFNPPSAPHFGGIWEAAVKSLKHHLRRVIGDAKLTFEEMSTFLTQVEACLNSRPLQALSDDPEDLAALTPGHFLVGAALTAVPEPSLLDEPTSRLSRWQLLQKMRDHFWERWSKEYLHSITHRPKWLREETGFKVGRLCLIRNELTPPTKWPLARIAKIHPGEDGQVRVVTLRTAASELVRPVVKLVVLPINGHGDHEPPSQ
ncbi:uncharacterized protein LOC112639871 [Camponotus floridanus]|uniref:uncharacterized protein LOC112639871 n=1 Tax=Camponotus floridanus TaxID=104421 RepID=UPI000DC6A3F2|nr:uncharacterized protein LOC112639871 [Camponotus floridanus]